MSSRLYLLPVALLAVLLAACGQQDLRVRAMTTITATIDAGGCQPGQWIVPGGATITATLTNSSSNSAQWNVLIYPATPPYEGMEAKDVYVAFSIPANTTLTENFTAPAMPGEYLVLCSEAGRLDKTPKATLVVVQP